ncbi:hypothetical protein SADUNF_Sadunf13G0049800 [Salix dunnii]|uniref:HNH nuclease domain-containing protein n=1 Tax=Salix dunnii TaxID=1413687 RepID=A0A835JKV2_9ROSI|nr:hypothetical protein SADUNF_Sadunf13G0049800 [Salix dunnii]
MLNFDILWLWLEPCTSRNIVSTVNLDCKLDLKQIALQARNAEYNPKRFAAVIMRIREPKTTALIFASGKMVCTGAKSEQQSKLAARKYARIIQKLGFSAKFKDFKIQNIVGSCDVKFPIRLEGLAYSHGAFSSYEPELFPGLIYRMKQPKIVLLIFVSGKIVITGAKVRDETYTAFENIYPVLTEFRKVQQWDLDRLAKAPLVKKLAPDISCGAGYMTGGVVLWLSSCASTEVILIAIDLMAQFTAQGRLKLPFNNDGANWKLLGNDFVGGLRSFQTQKRKIRFLGTSGTRLYSASSLSKKPKHFYTEASQSVSDVNDESEKDYERDELACFRGLVLDISYRPVNVVCWRRAICLEFMEKLVSHANFVSTMRKPSKHDNAKLLFSLSKNDHVALVGSMLADVLEYYDQAVNSPSGSFYIPAVLRVPHLLQVVKRRRIKSNLSRKNILYRDNFTCQYCSSRENLTIDHVLPTARGGEWKWENLVAACAKCNSKKGQKTPEEANMKLSKAPKAPKDYDILAIPLTSAAIRMLRMRKGMPEEWQQYLARPSAEP